MKAYNPNTGAEEPINDGWSQVMIMILRENWESMTDEELCDAIGVTPTKLRRKMNEFGMRRPKAAKPPKEKPVKQFSTEQMEKRNKRVILDRKKEEDLKRRNIEHAQKFGRDQRRERKVLPTRQQNFSQMRSIRVDSKTWIQVGPGEDADKAVREYRQRMATSGLNKFKNGNQYDD